MHLPAPQVVEQHSEPDAQFSPPPLQAGATGTAHFPFVHWPEQHSLAAEHWSGAGRHWPAGSTQVFAAHEFEQQSELEPHSPPIALHCDGSTHAPVHASEQQSDGRVQASESALQEEPPSEGSDPPPDFFLLQPTAPSAARRARSVKRERAGVRMKSSWGKLELPLGGDEPVGVRLPRVYAESTLRLSLRVCERPPR